MYTGRYGMEGNRSAEERTDPVDQIIRYHLQTKHHFNRYARALGYLDWANQPDPVDYFR